MTIDFEFATDVVDGVTARACADRFGRILDFGVAEPGVRICDIDILSASERAELTPVSGTAPVPAATLPDLLTGTVGTDPAAIAASCGDRRILPRPARHRIEQVGTLADRARRPPRLDDRGGRSALDRVGPRVGGDEVRGRIRPGRPHLSAGPRRTHALRFRGGARARRHRLGCDFGVCRGS